MVTAAATAGSVGAAAPARSTSSATRSSSGSAQATSVRSPNAAGDGMPAECGTYALTGVIADDGDKIRLSMSNTAKYKFEEADNRKEAGMWNSIISGIGAIGTIASFF